VDKERDVTVTSSEVVVAAAIHGFQHIYEETSLVVDLTDPFSDSVMSCYCSP
jgi:hypothetical protein